MTDSPPTIPPDAPESRDPRRARQGADPAEAPDPSENDLLDGLALATDGSGPLLERDYWAVVARARLDAAGVARLVAERFWEFPPSDLTRFRRADGTTRPLRVGDEMEVEIVHAGTFRVRVLHRDAGSLTIGTVRGHPEAGKITFGAYPNPRGDVVFHIRSRARSSSTSHRAGFLAAGEPMQTNTWSDFVNRLAATVGDGIVGFIHASTRDVAEVAESHESGDDRRPTPTFLARPHPDDPDETTHRTRRCAPPEDLEMRPATHRTDTPWRAGRGWSEPELARQLERLRDLPTNTSESYEKEMTAERGWRQVASEAIVAREAPGPPEPGGPFERARRAVADFQLSDPRIVEAHFARDGALAGRPMLLELKALGLRFLCGVRVAAVRDERVVDGAGGERTVWGFRYDTLRGHIERGVEWFLLEKDHGSGEIRFQIRARWQPGEFPNLWSRAGFAWLGPIHQEIWHRRAHQRVAALAAGDEPAPRREWHLRHEGPEVQLRGGRLRRTLDAGEVATAAAALGAMTGVKSMSAVTLLALARARSGDPAGPGRIERLLHRPEAALLLPLAAAGEAVADKLPVLPPRTDPPSLLARIALGAVAGATVAERQDRSPWGPALLGGAAALATTVSIVALRRLLTRKTALPDPVVGLAEDAGLLAVAAALSGRVG